MYSGMTESAEKRRVAGAYSLCNKFWGTGCPPERIDH